MSKAPFVNNPLLEKTLTDLGMIEGASEIYTYLLKKGPKMAKDVTKFVGGNKALVYRRLKFLMSKGFIKSTLDFPARFEAVPLGSIIDQFAESKKRELCYIKKSKERLQDILENLETEVESEKDEFSIMKSSFLGVTKCLAIAKQTKTEYLFMNDQLSHFQYELVKDIQLIASNVLRNKAHFRFITNVTNRNLNEAKQILKKINLDSPYAEIRHLALNQFDFPRFALGDERTVVFYFDELNSKTILDQEKLFWTTNVAFIRSMRLLFNELWQKSVDIRERIAELEGTRYNPSRSQKQELQVTSIESSFEYPDSPFENGHHACRARDSQIDSLLSN